MKLITSVLMLFILAIPGIAASKKSEGYLVKTTFQYKSGNKLVENSGELILSKENKTWITIANSKEGFMVLGRIIEAKNNTLEMEYIVIDSNKTPNGVISTPKIISKLGEDSLIEVKSEKDIVSLKMIATKTFYTN